MRHMETGPEKRLREWEETAREVEYDAARRMYFIRGEWVPKRDIERFPAKQLPFVYGIWKRRSDRRPVHVSQEEWDHINGWRCE